MSELSLFDMPAPDWSGQPQVRITNAETAAKWYGLYHYSGKRNPSSTDWGVFSPDPLALVSIGEAANVDGVAKKFGLVKWKGNKEITRVAVHPDAAKNTATRCIAMVLKRVAADYDWLFSYADTGQDHHGGIYQGLNAVYVGTSAARNGWLLDGEPIHPRSIVAKFGTQAKEAAPKLAVEQGYELVEVKDMNTMKHLYILPIGSKRTRSAIRKHLAPYAKPYPKRERQN